MKGKSRVSLIVNKQSRSNIKKAIGKSENASRITEIKDAKGIQQKIFYSIQKVMSVNFFYMSSDDLPTIKRFRLL